MCSKRVNGPRDIYRNEKVLSDAEKREIMAHAALCEIKASISLAGSLGASSRPMNPAQIHPPTKGFIDRDDVYFINPNLTFFFSTEKRTCPIASRKLFYGRNPEKRERGSLEVLLEGVPMILKSC